MVQLKTVRRRMAVRQRLITRPKAVQMEVLAAPITASTFTRTSKATAVKAAIAVSAMIQPIGLIRRKAATCRKFIGRGGVG